MSIVSKLKKNELKLVAEKIGLTVPGDAKMIDLNRLIEESDVFKEDYEFVKSVIEQVLEEVKTHKSQLNGAEATLANIRTKFWIVNGRSKVKRVIKQCIKCLKVSAKGKNQMMADLPSASVSIARVFNKVGLDFCGPFLIKLIPGEDNSKLLNWNLAKIVEVHPGTDDITRVVTLKTDKGVYKRPVTKIVKLPFNCN
ncbi:uncharacterized protein TNCT_425541 [Trichonephila clavata]|uniref:Integrase zinc-binding domain-containing protein n=1 Tax=Trichonephila clavata TaxID=2740835 RepID=A0A8X6LWD3_TRICU|nr:uncharacterized protein TNCT_425541 [Trichonephila clavata]